MDLEPDRVLALEKWAEENESVFELWLHGSRAEGTSTPRSDVDLAIVLMPRDRRTDWALFNYTSCWDKWKKELAAIVGRKVDLSLIESGTALDTGVRLWSRVSSMLQSTR